MPFEVRIWVSEDYLIKAERLLERSMIRFDLDGGDRIMCSQEDCSEVVRIFASHMIPYQVI